MPATTTVEDMIRRALADETGAADLEVYDIEVSTGLVRVLVERPGGVDLEALTLANRVVSAALDAKDPIPGTYNLEVSSPGLERPLRTPDHFARHVGGQVNVKTRAGVPGERRISGELAAADDGGITVVGAGGSRRLSYAEIDRARTVFEWGANSKKPGSNRSVPKRPAANGPTPKKPNPEKRSSVT